ncbi:MarR family transcriptional regulator [Candidatus Saccharibacteria bacterium]|nr:MarR family transcriptional regulator [Candidatus Saccharibacteria bacterium]
MSGLDDITMYEACLLHSRADRALRMVVAKELDQFGITMMQWLLLATTDKGPGSGMRMSELAEALNVTMPQITALMNDLIQLKFAKQKVNSTDRRSRRLTVTPLGKRQLQKIESAIDETMRRWLKNVPLDELASYMTTVKRLAVGPS